MRVAYFTPGTFRTVNAGALRNVGVARALALAGHEVAIFTPDIEECSPDWAQLLRGSPITIHAAGTRGIRFELFRRVGRYLGGATDSLSAKLESFEPNAIILYNSGPLAKWRLSRYAAAKSIPFVRDLTEWLNPSDSPGGKFCPLAWINEIAMRNLPHHTPRALVVSHQFASFLDEGGSDTLVVPPLFDPPDCVHLTDLRDRLVLTVSGGELNLNGKDGAGLRLIIDALALVDARGERIQLEIIGEVSPATEAYVKGKLWPEAATFDGRMSRPEVLAAVHASSFHVVLRDPTDRRASFGFPSKVPETLLVGTPILANRFSDLDEHLRDRENAVLLESWNIELLAKLLSQLGEMALDREQIRKDAIARYSPEAWSGRLSDFVFR